MGPSIQPYHVCVTLSLITCPRRPHGIPSLPRAALTCSCFLLLLSPLLHVLAWVLFHDTDSDLCASPPPPPHQVHPSQISFRHVRASFITHPRIKPSLLLDQGTRCVHHFRLKKVPHMQERLPFEPRCLYLKLNHDLPAQWVPSEIPKLPTPAPGLQLLLGECGFYASHAGLTAHPSPLIPR